MNKKLALIFCIAISTGQVHGMAAVVELFEKISVIPKKEERELRSFQQIGPYSCHDKSFLFRYKEIQEASIPDSYPFDMFVNSSKEEVSSLLKELTLGTKTHILEYDFRKPKEITRWERNQQVFRLFEDAVRLYEETGEPVIVHFHHIESAVVRDHPDAFTLHLLYDPFQRGGRPIYFVSSTETFGNQIRDDFLSRHGGSFYTIEGNHIYTKYDFLTLKADNAKIQTQNCIIQIANASIIGGVTGVLLAMALKVIKHGEIQKKPQATESALGEKNE